MIGFTEFAVVSVTLVLSIIAYFKWSHQYWARRNTPYIQPSIPWGTSKNPITAKTSFMLDLKDLYQEFRSNGHGYGGLYLMTKPAFVAVKPDLIRRILAKDFSYFTGHGIHVDEEKDPVSGNLFVLEGEKWRNLRVKLTPTFTSGKMKMMYPTLLACGVPMVDHINKLSQNGEPLDIKEILACFTTDVIGSCAFGVDCDSFKNPDADFRKHGRKIFETSWTRNLVIILNLLIPKLRLESGNNGVRDFFVHTFRSIVNHRLENNIKRNDFVQLLLELKDKPGLDGVKDGLTIDQMTAQAIMFFAAGFETSSTTMTFTLHELSFNLDIQERLRKEIVETIDKYDGKITYDAIMEMKYLNMVIDESLRKHPAAALINRVCDKDYTIEETGDVIEKGMPVFISTFGLHRDPEYYPNPERFDPERFSDENKPKIQNYTYLPFGEGPRNCIGLRFGVMQAKVGLCLLLKNFVFTPHESMRYDMGGYHKGTIVLSFKDTLLLNAQRIG